MTHPPRHFLRAWREFRDLTQEQVAEKLGTAKGVISLLENGKRSINEDWLRKFADVLNTSPGSILDHPPQQDEESPDKDVPETASERLRRARSEAGYETASEAAEALGTSVSTYLAHENGSRGYPSKVAAKYAEAFKVRPEWLIFGTGESEFLDKGEGGDEQSSDRPRNYLKDWREHRHLTRAQLAEAVGTSVSMLGYLENGRSQLTHAWLLKLADVLGATPGTILDFHPKDKRLDALPELQLVRAEQRHFLKAWRKHRGLTQAEVAGRLALLDQPDLPETAASLSRIENGRQLYGQAIIEALAEIYECRRGELIDHHPDSVADLQQIWDRIDEDDRPKALKLLQALVGD